MKNEKLIDGYRGENSLPRKWSAAQRSEVGTLLKECYFHEHETFPHSTLSLGVGVEF